MAKQRKKRGSARMREQGYTLVQVWLDAAELPLVVDQAKREGRPVANYLRFHGVERARSQKTVS